MTEEFMKDIKNLNDFWFDLQNNKVNKITFEEKASGLFSDIREIKIQVNTASTDMNNLENFIEKYIPLQTQNWISRTLHGYLNQVQIYRLEDYELSVFAKLHNNIFQDDGQPDLDSEKQTIISEVNDKLNELKKLYSGRHIRAKSLTGVTEEDSDDPQQNVDGEDITEVLQKKIKDFQRIVDKFPVRFRELDEKIHLNIDNLIETNEKRIKILEEHITEISNEVESNNQKLNEDKAEMILRVEGNTELMENFKEDYITKSKMLKSLSGTTAWLLEAACIKAWRGKFLKYHWF